MVPVDETTDVLAYATISPARETFARLISAERIGIRYSSTPTPYFNLETREIVMPFFKDITDDEEILFVTHEISHGKHTPPKKWKAAIDSFPKEEQRSFQGYLNIVEDARIERKIKGAYPGLRPCYVRAYKSLQSKNFFGLEDQKDLTKLGLIDRLNLSAKIGGVATVPIPMSAEDMLWYTKMQRTQTFEEVVALAKALYEKAKEDAQTSGAAPQTDRHTFTVEGEGDEGEDGEGQEVDADGNPNGKKKSKKASEKGKGTTRAGEQAKRSSGMGDGAVVLPAPSTDSSAMEYLQKRQTPNAVFEQTEFPVFNRAETIVPMATMLETGRKSFRLNKSSLDNYLQFKREVRPTVVAMAAAFERQKSAKASIRAMHDDTGRLDPRRLFTAKVREDIFERMTVLPKGKNHGFVILLDWSSSMMSSMPALTEQLYFLASFFRMIRVPFEVYAFSDSGVSSLMNQNSYRSASKKIENATTSFGMSDSSSFHLLQFLSPRATAKDFDDMMSWLYCYYHDRGVVTTNSAAKEMFGQSGTPMLEGLVAIRNQMLSLKMAHNLDKTHLVVISDGGNGSSLNTRTGSSDKSNFAVNLVDTVTGITHRWSSNAKELLPMLYDWIRFTTKATITWYYLTPNLTQDAMGLARALNTTYPPKPTMKDNSYALYSRWGGCDAVALVDIGVYGLSGQTSSVMAKKKILLSFVKLVS